MSEGVANELPIGCAESALLRAEFPLVELPGESTPFASCRIASCPGNAGEGA